MKKKIGFSIFLAFFALLFSYISGMVAQLFSNHALWQQMGGITGGIPPPLPSLDFGACIKALLHPPYGLYGLGVTGVGLGLLFLYFFKGNSSLDGIQNRQRNMLYSDKGTYGTSGFMTKDEMKKVLEHTKDLKHCRGTILGELDGKAVCVPENTPMNKNIAVFGASGSMKSRAYARNMIFQCVRRGDSLFITDPKSELYASMSLYLRDNGYIVKVFNLVNPENSDSWNCLGEIEGQELYAQIFSDVIIKNTGSNRGDHFWDNSELCLLKALCLYVDQSYPPENRNIGEVYKLLTMSSDKELAAIFNALPPSHPAKAPFSIFQQAGDSVRGGIIIGLGSRIQVFQNQLIRNITSTDEIDLSLPGKKKCAYFCITSDQDSTFDFLSSLFLSFLFIKLVRYADKDCEQGALPVSVHILADELANIGVIPDLTKKISTIRSRGISMSVIFQNIAQMQNRYPQNQWQEIIGNADTQLFLGCTDEVTAKFISDRTGDITVGVGSTSKQLHTMRMTNWTPEFRETASIGKRKLLTPDEVLRFPLNKALIILRGQKVLEVNKFDYTKHPESKKMRSCNARDHVPDWRNASPKKPPPQQEFNETDEKEKIPTPIINETSTIAHPDSSPAPSVIDFEEISKDDLLF